MKHLDNTSEKLSKMPFKLIESGTSNQIILDTIEFLQEEDSNYFRVSNFEGKGINIKYIPTRTSSWNKETFEIYLLENPYLNAENDVFQVYEDTILSERLGWIFPITILESNENDYVDFKNLNDYKYIAYQKLFELEKEYVLKTNWNEFISLGEIFGNIIICILCKDTITKIPDFKFENYILSLYKDEYLLLHDTPKAKAIYDKSAFISEMRSRKRINLSKSKFDIMSNDFTKSLFKEHLLQSDSFIIRFIFLYQIIEHFIQLEFEKQFQTHLDDFQGGRISKNDLRENLNNSSKERVLISNIISRINISHTLKNEFITECDFLFYDIGQISKETLHDKIYDIRNLLTHRLREVTSKLEALEKIVELFERIIVDLLSKYEIVTS